jgi:hypothetical protein
MDISEFYDTDKGTAVKFAAIGDSTDGVIRSDPKIMPSKYDPNDKVLVVALLTDDGEKQDIFAGRQLQQRIAEAVIDAKATDLAVGGRLTIVRVDDRMYLNGRTGPDFKVVYELPIADPAVSDPWSDEAIGTAELVDGDDAVSV